MLAVYVSLIQKGVITIDGVPASSQSKVAEALASAETERSKNNV
ncbi:CD1375 family protein [Paenibacillus illinoisensis]|nr:CD1375 family protein [Paenibacillus illinoisensis]